MADPLHTGALFKLKDTRALKSPFPAHVKVSTPSTGGKSAQKPGASGSFATPSNRLVKPTPKHAVLFGNKVSQDFDNLVRQSPLPKILHNSGIRYSNTPVSSTGSPDDKSLPEKSPTSTPGEQSVENDVGKPEKDVEKPSAVVQGNSTSLSAAAILTANGDSKLSEKNKSLLDLLDEGDSEDDVELEKTPAPSSVKPIEAEAEVVKNLMDEFDSKAIAGEDEKVDGDGLGSAENAEKESNNGNVATTTVGAMMNVEGDQTHTEVQNTTKEQVEDNHKGDADVDKVEQPKERKPVVLSDWYLKPYWNGKMWSLDEVPSEGSALRVVLFGTRTDTQQTWHSSFVNKIHDRRIVETKAKEGRIPGVYELMGRPSSEKMLDGWSGDFLSKFEEGFPHNWMDVVFEYLKNALCKEPTKRDECVDTNTRKTRSAKKSNHNTPIAPAPAPAPAPEQVLDEDVEVVEEREQDVAIPPPRQPIEEFIAKEEAESNPKLMRLMKQLQVKGCDRRRDAARMALDQGNTPKTRRNRIIVKPVEYWKGEVPFSPAVLSDEVTPSSTRKRSRTARSQKAIEQVEKNDDNDETAQIQKEDVDHEDEGMETSKRRKSISRTPPKRVAPAIIAGRTRSSRLKSNEVPVDDNKPEKEEKKSVEKKSGKTRASMKARILSDSEDDVLLGATVKRVTRAARAAAAKETMNSGKATAGGKSEKKAEDDSGMNVANKAGAITFDDFDDDDVALKPKRRSTRKRIHDDDDETESRKTRKRQDSSNAASKNNTSKSSSWTDEDVQKLKAVCMQLDPKHRNFFSELADHFPGKSARQCADRYYQSVEDALSRKRDTKKDSAKAATDEGIPDGPIQITGGAGTMKRMKQIRKAHERVNANHVDDAFESTPLKGAASKLAQPFVKRCNEVDGEFDELMKQAENEEEDDDSSDNTSDESKSSSDGEPKTPGLLRPLDRNRVEPYVHRLRRETSKLAREKGKEEKKASLAKKTKGKHTTARHSSLNVRDVSEAFKQANRVERKERKRVAKADQSEDSLGDEAEYYGTSSSSESEV